MLQYGQEWLINITTSESPVDTSSKCQNSYILVIGDGGWINHSKALGIVSNLYTKDKIKTFTVAYGGGIGSGGISNFRKMAQAGGTNDVIIADTTASLKTQLKAAISQIIAAKLSFTAPAISATVEKGGDLYQAQFEYKQNKEWTGTLTRTAIDGQGNVIVDDSGNWSAREKLPNPDARNIWTVLDTTDYKPSYNNFVRANASEINGMFERLGNEVAGYHSKTSTNDPANTTRCSGKTKPGSADIADGNADDINGLIDFIRGKDYFDYDSDCDLTEMRTTTMDRSKYEGDQATEETKKAVIRAYLEIFTIQKWWLLVIQMQKLLSLDQIKKHTGGTLTTMSLGKTILKEIKLFMLELMMECFMLFTLMVPREDKKFGICSTIYRWSNANNG